MMIPRLSIAAALLASHALSAPTLTTIQDVLYKADGTRFNGTLVITWNSFQAADNSTIVKQSTTVRVSDGNLRVQLVPSTSATPATFYSVTYNSDGRVQFKETWSVPAGGQPVRLRDVRVSASAAPSTGGAPAPEIGSISQADVMGLVEDLENRPLKGAGFAPNRVALVSATGALEAVLGAENDCVHVDGSSGPCGAQGVSFVDGEPPAGVVDGSNAVFSLAATPAPASSLLIYRNGLLQKPEVDYTLNGRNIQFVAAARPQPGDVLLTSYRLANIDPGTPQVFPGAQVLCSGVGAATSQSALTSLGICSIPAGVLGPGDRIEIRFNYQHQGTASGFSVEIRWGASTVLHRDAATTETLVTGRADAGISTSGAQWSAQSWGGVLPFSAGVANTSDAYANGLAIDFLGAVTPASGDSITLSNFTVVRFP
jgi:hypothetical protein